MWPGFGENIRVVDWMLRRINNEDVARPSPIGLLPKPGSLDISGLSDLDLKELFSVPRDYWLEDVEETRTFFEKQVGSDLPEVVAQEVSDMKERIVNM